MLRAKCCLNWPDGIPIWKSLNLPIGRILELFFDFLGWWRSQCFFWDFFLVVVITIDMCCAYVRRRRFNEMQQLYPNVTKLVRLFSRYFSISFCFVFFFPRLVLWLSFRLETNRDLYGYFYNISTRRVKGRLDDDGVVAEAGAREKVVTTPTEKFPFQ